MDAQRFDAVIRALTEAGTRRGVLGWLAATTAAGGLLALFDPDAGDAKGRRKRRKKRHKHGNGRRRQKPHNQHKGCKPQPAAQTCAGTCGSVQNNCRKTVDCGACTCDPACGVCERCTGTTCETCDPCCNGVCCQQEHAICHATSAECCVPDSKATTCDGQCGPVVNNCGVTVSCGSCVCDPVCPACQICDEDTGDCIADPDQDRNTCGAAQTCDQGTVTPQGSCNASGACVPADQVSCDQYAVCDGSACATACGSTEDCRAGFFCDQDHHCVSEHGDGQSCAIDEECSSGFCVANVCCHTVCDGPCEVCDASGKVGTCTVTVGATCGSSSCTAGVLTPAPVCLASGACQPGSPVSCSPYKACAGNACASGCAADADCVGGAFCNDSGQCVSDLEFLSACHRDAQCQTGHCVEGICCISACDTACNTCTSDRVYGVCVPKTSGTPCGGGQICCCGACQAGSTCGTGAAFGAACTSDGDCASGLCGCPAIGCAGGGICVDRYDCDPIGCLAAGGGNYLTIHPGSGGELVCSESSGGGCQSGACPAGQVCHLTGNLCLVPKDVAPVTTPA